MSNISDILIYLLIGAGALVISLCVCPVCFCILYRRRDTVRRNSKHKLLTTAIYSVRKTQCPCGQVQVEIRLMPMLIWTTRWKNARR